MIPLPGMRLNHYEIRDEIGAGGMGVVFKAYDHRLGRMVALKFLSQHLLDDQSARERLMFEAQAAARLDHPNIGTIFAIEEVDEQLFIVMAYYQGDTVAAMIEHRPLPWQKALSLIIQIAEGLGVAHQHSVIHRDIKPGNLLLTQQGLIKILDFGLAMLKQPGENSAQGVIGTVSYMSPEQAKGQAIDHRSDIWSLGVVLYQMLTASNPFFVQGNITKTLIKIIQEEPIAVSEIKPEVPKPIDDLLAKALAKDVDQRYSHVEAMIEDAQAILAEESKVVIQPPMPATKALLAPVREVKRPKRLVPGHQTPLLGRDDEVDLITMYLRDPDCQLVTLLGPGGIGKTRLGYEVSLQLRDYFSDGVYFIALEGLQEAAFIPSTILETLGLAIEGQGSPLEQLLQHLEYSHSLLVLDNYEHVMQEAMLVSDILLHCPHVKILVTSRERLQLEEEWIVPLQGLPYPEGSPDQVVDAMHFGAIELFVERAKKVSPVFELDQTSLPGVVAICQAVKGFPLAVELAAAWVRMMTPEMIHHEVQKNIDFLTSRSRNMRARHRSLRAVFEYSWQLLDEDEQAVFEKLAIFQGGFSQHAFQTIIQAPMMVLAELLDKSLMQISESRRYQHHPVLLPFLKEKLALKPDEVQAFTARHREYYLHLLIDKGRDLRGAAYRLSMQAITAELENIHTAWGSAIQAHAYPLINQAAEPLRFFYDSRGLIDEGLAFFNHAIDTLHDKASGANQASLAILGLKRAHFHHVLGHYVDAEHELKEGLQHLKPEVHARDILLGINTLAIVHAKRGDLAEAKALFQQALGLAQEDGSPDVLQSILNNLGNLEQALGDYHRSKECFQESLRLAKEQSNHSQVVYTLNNLGSLAMQFEKTDEAKQILEEALVLAREVDVHRPLAAILGNLGLIAYEQQRYDDAQTILGDALVYVKESGERWLEANFLLLLARIFEKQGEVSEAKKALKRALGIAQAMKDLRLQLSLVGQLLILDNRSHPSKERTERLRFIYHEYAEDLEPDLRTVLSDVLSSELKEPLEHVSPFSLEAIIGEYLKET